MPVDCEMNYGQSFTDVTEGRVSDEALANFAGW